MSVSAIIVTRGNVSLRESMETIPEEWERLVWCNGSGLYRWDEDIAGDGHEVPTWQPVVEERQDLAVYGRYEAIQYASHDLIYVQDDDCVVSDPDAIVRAYYEDMLACNMPQRFRHSFYEQHALVGFGAAFHRDMPSRAFDAFFEMGFEFEWPHFHRTCDIVFTGLTPSVLVDVLHTDRPYASDPDRMWMQSTHQGERAHMLDLVMKTKEAL